MCLLALVASARTCASSRPYLSALSKLPTSSTSRGSRACHYYGDLIEVEGRTISLAALAGRCVTDGDKRILSAVQEADRRVVAVAFRSELQLPPLTLSVPSWPSAIPRSSSSLFRHYSCSSHRHHGSLLRSRWHRQRQARRSPLPQLPSNAVIADTAHAEADPYARALDFAPCRRRRRRRRGLWTRGSSDIEDRIVEVHNGGGCGGGVFRPQLRRLASIPFDRSHAPTPPRRNAFSSASNTSLPTYPNDVDVDVGAARYVRIGSVTRRLGPASSERSSGLLPVGYLPPSPSQTFLSHLRWMLTKDNLGQDMLLVGPPGAGSAYRRKLAMAYGELTRREVEVSTLSRDATEADLKQRRELIGGGTAAECKHERNRRVTDGGSGSGGNIGEGDIENGKKRQRQVQRGGTKVHFANQSPVRAALHGRLLILDGLERSERNVLPALNNLLENREMHLEDGRLLVSSERYRDLIGAASSLSSSSTSPSLPKEGMTREEEKEEEEKDSRSSFLVPVHEDFRVVALGVPCPPYDGAGLDPPLRSRFQIRRVDNPTATDLYSDLLLPMGDHPSDALLDGVSGGSGSSKFAISEKVAALCAKFAGAMEDATNVTLSLSSSSPESGGGHGRRQQRQPLAFPFNALPSVARTLTRFPLEDRISVLLRAYPAGVDDERFEAIFSGNKWEASRAAVRRACDKLGIASSGDGGGQVKKYASRYVVRGVKRMSPSDDGETGRSGKGIGWDHRNIAEVTFAPSSRRREDKEGANFWTFLSPSADGDDVTTLVPCGPNSIHPASTAIPSSSSSPSFGRYVRTVGHSSVVSAMMQEHASGQDVLLLSPRREGKSPAAFDFASMLGYDVELFGLYRDVTGKDLLMRRATDAATGETRWEESPLVRAAMTGRICILDGAEKVSGDALATLQGLLIDREAALPDGRKLIWVERSSGRRWSEIDSDRVAAGVVPIHPSFRVVALASISRDAGSSWLSEDVMSMFGTVTIPKPNRESLRAILASSNESCPADIIDKVLDFHGLLNGDTAADCGVSPLSTRNLLRIVKRASDDSDAGSLHDIICSVLVADLLPPTQRYALETILKRASISKRNKTRDGRARDDVTPEIVISVQNDRLSIGDFNMTRSTVKRPEMVPAPLFFDIPSHVDAIKDLLSEWKSGERSFLLLGNQGVGKNKIVDRICELANWEREYMQLHRDSTIGQLTLSPSLDDGRIVWNDSALVRAVSVGCCLVVDEADKAPVEVVSVLKGLVEDGELLLADGRRISRNRYGEGIIPIHPEFTIWVLANRPGWPFHGNDFFREIGDCFSTRVIPNPDLRSEINLLRSYAPTLDDSVLHQIAGSFADLRMMSDHGDISYPYSTREAVSVVKHLEMYPEDDIVSTLHNVLDIDSFDDRLYAKIGEVFQRHGIPVTDYPTWREALNRTRHVTSGDHMGDLSISYFGDRSTDGKSVSPPPLSLPKRGRWDENNDPHIGGNQWAGGTGGSDTAGLGGRGGPYRLDRGHKVHQVSDAAKAEVSKEAAEAAREMAQQALEERLAEIGMSQTEWKMYDSFVEPIRGDVANLRGTLSSVESRRSERGWIKRQDHGELDDSKLVEGVAGDKYIYKRRGNIDPQAGRPLQSPKRLRFVLDISGSMYRFNGYDQRLNRCLEAAALVMESFEGIEQQFDYSIVGHSGDSSCIPLVEFGNPPSNAKERMRILQSMVAHAQYCQSGDNTLEAMARAITDVSDEGKGYEADEHIVIGVSDANLSRYGIHPRQLGKIMEEGAVDLQHPVKAYCIFIASLGREAEDIKQALPVGKGFVCMQTSELPRVVKNILSAQVR